MTDNNPAIEILYRDEEIVIINKPGGLLSVPGRGPQKRDCAASRLRHLLPNMLAQPAVHRLDMYTSGLMVFAMTPTAHRFLSMQFEQRHVTKHYLAIVDGVIEKESGKIQLPFRLDLENRPLQIYDPVQGKLGVTIWEKLAIERATTRIQFTPLTGRTHQLRVHAAHPLGLDTPIVGDSLYGRGSDGDQMMLHATFLRFLHPTTEEFVAFSSPAPF
jgi:tRNA pseudouridine32 synthase/23S rRNA pseudouridine746 synthase